MLAVARARTDSLYLRRGRAESLPFTPPGFDLIFSVVAVSFQTKRVAFFREAVRLLRAGGLLRPGGRLCTVTDSAEDIRRRRPLSSHFPESVEVELACYPRIATIQAEMDATGFGSTWTATTEQGYQLTDIQGYRERAYSSLHLIPDDAFQRGIGQMENELNEGSVEALALYTLVWGAFSTSSSV